MSGGQAVFRNKDRAARFLGQEGTKGLAQLGAAQYAAAKGVPFLAPANPREPLDDQTTMLPEMSESEILVLL